MAVMKYRKKPVEIEAVQLRWSEWNDVCEFLGNMMLPVSLSHLSDQYSDPCDEVGPYLELSIPTLEGAMAAKHGDYIIKGVNGEFYPCKPDIFEKTYELVAVGGNE